MVQSSRTSKWVSLCVVFFAHFVSVMADDGVFLKRHETEIIPWDFESGHSAHFRVSSNNGAPILEHLMLPC
ncbi:hypothetical protein CK203_080887 [Vitis vinifera]|uniref:Uncharacterized protein n=1 Tax=Vitis vinifera TaxID=29760 RepID=A0A438C0B3_VITVI|nr:hypothetical protein CK203_080887 [Vitis vinifera]